MFLTKLKTELPDDPTISLLGMYLEENMIQKDMHIPMFLEAVFMVAKTRKPHKCPLTDEWTKKMWYICTINIAQP